MKKAFRKLISKIMPSKWRKQLRNFITLSRHYGQYKSIKTVTAILRDEEPVPWYTYPAIEFLLQFDFSDKNVFEYGSGNSTLFYAKRCKTVISVEHDIEWFNATKKKSLSNVSLILEQSEKDYVNVINKKRGKFDIIVIDGICRKECARQIEKNLTKNGMVIFDNTDWYPKTCNFFRDSLDMIQVDFHGFGPINNYTWTTSVFMMREINLRPSENQPQYSIGALERPGHEEIDFGISENKEVQLVLELRKRNIAARRIQSELRRLHETLFKGGY